jgi:hypothetical protein
MPHPLRAILIIAATFLTVSLYAEQEQQLPPIPRNLLWPPNQHGFHPFPNELSLREAFDLLIQDYRSREPIQAAKDFGWTSHSTSPGLYLEVAGGEVPVFSNPSSNIKDLLPILGTARPGEFFGVWEIHDYAILLKMPTDPWPVSYGTWYKVLLNDGRYGWVHNSTVRTITIPVPPPPPTFIQRYGGVIGLLWAIVLIVAGFKVLSKAEVGSPPSVSDSSYDSSGPSSSSDDGPSYDSSDGAESDDSSPAEESETELECPSCHRSYCSWVWECQDEECRHQFCNNCARPGLAPWEVYTCPVCGRMRPNSAE